MLDGSGRYLAVTVDGENIYFAYIDILGPTSCRPITNETVSSSIFESQRAT